MAARRWPTWSPATALLAGRYLVCPICFDARKLDKGQLIEGAELGGTVPLWQWIGDDQATTFSY
jgi:hypothetical protein